MLREAFEYLMTPCARPYRQMGYLSELIATKARAKRCGAAWRLHQEKTKAVITEAVAKTKVHRKAIVLGGGLMSDIPLKLLCDRFNWVGLIDVCFHRDTRTAAAHHVSARLVTCDVTGAAKPLYEGTLSLGASPPEVILDDADLIISANVLSQLPLIPLAYLRKAHSGTDEDAADRFAQNIISKHINFLKNYPATVCLITEIERQFVNNGLVLNTEDPLFGVPLDMQGEEWLWDMAPRPEASPNYDVRNRVRGAIWQGA